MIKRTVADRIDVIHLQMLQKESIIKQKLEITNMLVFVENWLILI